MFKKLIGSGIVGIAKQVGDTSLKLRTAITGDLPPDTKVQLAEIQSELDEIVAAGSIRQNVLDSAKGLFFSGWRALAGWISVTAFGIHTIGNWIIDLISDIYGLGLTPIELEIQIVLYVLGALLGIGGFRTYEKYKGVQNKH